MLRADCQWPDFSQALMAALQVTVLGCSCLSPSVGSVLALCLKHVRCCFVYLCAEVEVFAVRLSE